MSVLLVEESSLEAVPKRLEQLAGALCAAGAAVEVLHRDLFVAVLVVLMLEKGFFPNVAGADDESDESAALAKLPLTWKRSDGSYEMKFVLKEFTTDAVKIVVTPLGGMMLVNAVLVDMDNDVYSECVPLSLHVVAPLASTVPMKYRNLSQLANILKSRVVSPVRSKIVRNHGFESASLMGLSREVLCEIFLYLNVKDIISVSQTCFEMQWVKNDNNLWHALLKRDYPKVEVSENLDYLQQYIQQRVKCSELRRKESSRLMLARRAGNMHQYMDHSDYVSNIENYYNYD